MQEQSYFNLTKTKASDTGQLSQLCWNCPSEAVVTCGLRRGITWYQVHKRTDVATIQSFAEANNKTRLFNLTERQRSKTCQSSYFQWDWPAESIIICGTVPVIYATDLWIKVSYQSPSQIKCNNKSYQDPNQLIAVNCPISVGIVPTIPNYYLFLDLILFLAIIEG
jgi:hypothetical protein